MKMAQNTKTLPAAPFSSKIYTKQVPQVHWYNMYFGFWNFWVEEDQNWSNIKILKNSKNNSTFKKYFLSVMIWKCFMQILKVRGVGGE